MRKTLILSAAAGAALAAVCASGPAFAQTGTESATSDAPASTSTRASIAEGQSVSGKLDPAGDTDWYRIRLRAGRGYAISLAGEGDEKSKLGDPTVRLLNSRGEEVAKNDDGPDGLDSLLVYAPDSSGTYYIEARGFADDATGGYRLSVEHRDLPPDTASANVRTRARLTLGQDVTEALAPAGDKDWYRIDLTSGQSYRFSLNGDSKAATPLGDPYLRILDATGAELASDDDGGEGLNSYLEFTPTATGHYFVEASSFGDGGEGGYVLHAAAGDIPGDATTDVSLSADGDYREGVLSPAGDSDWYKINLDAGQTVRIGLNSGTANPLGDPYLVIHGADGAELAHDDDSGDGLNSWLEFTAATAGAYFVEARGFGDGAEGSYVLSLTAGEIGGTADTADALEVGGEGRTSRIDPAGDQDWFAITMVEGRPYRINVLSAGDAPLADPLLTLYGADGASLAADDDGGTGLNSYLTFTPTQSGIYYAAVSSFGDGATGGYTIHVSDTDVPGNDSTDEVLNAAEGDDRESLIDFPGDLDFYAVDLEANTRYVITVSGVGDHPLGDPMLTVKSSSGEDVGSDDDSGPGYDSRLVFRPTEAGRYYLQASGLGGSTGRYKIAIATQPAPAPQQQRH